MLLMSMLLVLGSVFAEEMEPLDACTDQFIIAIIYNDPLFTGGVLKCPQGISNDVSGCPAFGPTGMTYHMSFPDTLPFVEDIAALEAAHPSEPLPLHTTVSDWWHKDVLTGTAVGVPPEPKSVCCVDGIFWKARMFDSATSTWSNWTDVNAPGQMNAYDPETNTLFALINTSAFKIPDWSGNMVFDCNVDTVHIYVWDCADEPGMEGTFGEFSAKKVAYPGPDPMGTEQVILRRYTDPGAIDDNKPKLPTEFFISQNTPNPFNATTAIQYGLPVDAEVRIEVTNLLGNKVATLIDDWQSAGFKRIVWDGRDNTGKDLPSGVYFYQIKANDFLDKKRAILMK